MAEREADKPLVGNAADPKQVKKAAKKENRRRLQDLADIKQIASLPAGLRFFHRYVNKICRVLLATYDPNPSAMCFKEGQRMIGNTMLRDLHDAAPDALLKVLTEGDRLYGDSSDEST